LSASGYRVSASAASGSTDWARLVIVEEPEHWPESFMADIARLDPAAVRVNALECRAGRFLVAFHNGAAVVSMGRISLRTSSGSAAGMQEPRRRLDAPGWMQREAEPISPADDDLPSSHSRAVAGSKPK
jgi:hypothetical protein